MSDTPAKVSLNLDTIEREGQTPEPFAFVLKGTRFEIQNPTDLDWQVLVDMGTEPRDTMRAFLGDAYDDFAAHKVPMWKLDRLIEAVQRHYGIEDDAGNAPASSTS